MKKKNKYNLEELMACAKEMLFGPGNAQLPLPPMLMFDRITNIETDIEAPLECKASPIFSWFFSNLWINKH